MKLSIQLLSAALLLFFLSSCAQNEPDTLNKIRERHQIRFATSSGYVPFSLYNTRKELVGFDVDMAREIAKRLGVKAVIVDTPWNNIIETLRSGAVDAIVSSMAVTQERSSVIAFSEPYYYTRSHLFVGLGSPIKNLPELKGKTVACSRGTTYEREARRLGAKEVVLCENDEEALRRLMDRQVDAVITDEIVGMYAIRHRRLPIEPLGSYVTAEQIAVAVRKEDVSLLKEINDIIKTMRSKGVIRELIKKTGQGLY